MNLRIILIDADVVSHFITAGRQESIHLIFQNAIHILDKVHVELTRFAGKGAIVNSIISKGYLQLMPFPENDAVIKQEYFWIKKMLDKGDGESASMAVARYCNNIIASSNLRDIKSYCSNHKMDYLTTMDFLCHAKAMGIWTEAECDDFISKVLAKRSKLPCTKMKDHLCRSLAFVNS